MSCLLFSAYKLTWQRYHRYSDHVEYLNYLQSEYPNLVSVVDVGNSIEGRAIKVIKISSGKPNAKAMWIDGGINNQIAFINYICIIILFNSVQICL